MPAFLFIIVLHKTTRYIPLNVTIHMAQTLRLKRSSVAGRVPTTSSLQTGEIAINTADGLVYIRKDDASIIPLLGLNNVTTGDIFLTGSVYATTFVGNVEGGFTGSLSNPLSSGLGIETFSYDSSEAAIITLDTGSDHFISGSRKAFSVVDTIGANGIDLEYDEGTGELRAYVYNDYIFLGQTEIELGQQVESVDLLTITRLKATGSFTGSMKGELTGSFQGVATGSFTGSFIGELQGQATTAISASHALIADTALNVVSVDTGSLLADASVSDATLTFTQGDGTTFDRTINNVVNATSASYASQADNATTADSATTATSADTATSASHADFAATASYALNVDPIDTGSFFVSVSSTDDTVTFTQGDGTTEFATINNVQNAYTASSADNFEVRNDATVGGDLTVQGKVTAEEFHTTFISASIVYSSGSTKFGDTLDDTHQFTGSLDITGSVTALSFTGPLYGQADTAISASHAVQADNAISASYASQADNATTADSATTATSADTATSASHAVYADSAGLIDTGTDNFISGARAAFTFNDTAGPSGVDFTFSPVTGILTANLNEYQIQLGDTRFDLGDTVDSISGLHLVSVKATGSFLGNLSGTAAESVLAATATSASYAAQADNAATADYATSAGSATTATSASHALQADNAISASYADYAATASYALNVDPIDTGSFVVNATVSDDTLTFTQGDGTTFNRTINNVASATSASHALIADTALNVVSIDTGSLLEDVSVSDDTLTFTQGDNTTFDRTINNVQNAYTASSADDFDVRGDLTVAGIVTAREFHTTFVSSSIVFSSGSTKFGDSADDIHSFTGSLTVSGSVTANEFIGNALSATTAISASHAVQADNAITADSATSATSAVTADSATSASYADFALTASYASNVDPIDTGSFLNNATVSNATLTFTRGDGTTFNRTIDNVSTATTATSADTATSASHAVQADSALSSSYADLALTASYALHVDQINTGSFVIGATVSDDTLTFTQGDGTTFDRVINNTVSASYALVAETALNVETGSFIITASISDDTITLTKGDGSEFDLIVNNVAAATSASFASSTISASHALVADVALNVVSIDTGSLLDNATVSDATLTFTRGDNTTFDRTINNVVTAETASYIVNAISSSFADFATSSSHALVADIALNVATGSLFESASVANDTITLVSADGTSVDLVVNNVQNAYTASYVENGISASYAATASSANDFLVRGDLDVQGIVTAKEFHTTFVSASIIYASGSTQFGDTDDDVHNFSGSIIATGNVTATDVSIDDWGSISASLANINTTAGSVSLQTAAETGNTITGGINVGIGSGNPTLKLVVMEAANDYHIRSAYTSGGTNRYMDIGHEKINISNSSTGYFQILLDGSNAATVSTTAFNTQGSISSGNKLSITTVDNATTDTDKFLVVQGTEVRYRTGAQVASDIGALTSVPSLDQVTSAGDITTNNITVGDISGSALTLTNVVNAGEDTDKFLVLDSNGNVDFRTGAQVLSDINGAAAGIPTFQQVTDEGNTTTNNISVAGISGSSLDITGNGKIDGGVNLGTVNNAGEDTDKFLVLDSDGNVDYRTGAEVLSDIGAGGATLNLQDVTDNGNTSTNDIIVAAVSGSSLDITGTGVIGGVLTLETVNNAGEDTDKFLVVDSAGNVEFRTGDEMVGDLGIATSSFDGNRGITNPLLPDLVDYNPGTSNVKDFLEQVFYPVPGADIEILTNDPFYIVESARSESIIYNGDNGYSGDQARFTATVAVDWTLQSNSFLSIDENGYLSLKTDLSGSVYQAPQTISGTVIATGQLGGTKSRAFTVSITNDPNPTLSAVNTAGIVHKAAHKTTPSSPPSASFPNDSIPIELFISDPRAVTYAGHPTITTLTGSGAEYFSIEADPNRQTTSASSKASYYTLFRTAAINSGSYVLEVTGSDDYQNIVSSSITITVNANAVPTVTQTTMYKSVSNATNGDTLGSITATDSQGEDVSLNSLSGADASKFVTSLVGSVGSTTTYNLVAAEDLSAKVYNVTASFSDDFGYTVLFPIEVEVFAAAPSKPQPNGVFYIIESAESGSHVTTATSGIAGTKGKLTTDQEVTWSISPTTILHISQSGELSVSDHISGSSTYVVGYPIVATVTATNGSGLTNTTDITVTVTDNEDPDIATNFTASVPHFSTLSSGKKIGTITVSDPQSYENVELTDLTGTDAAKFSLSSETAAQSVEYVLTTSQTLNSGSYSITINALDAFGQTASQNATITVAENTPPTFAYAGDVATYASQTFTVDVNNATSGSDFGTVTLSTILAEEDAVEGIVLEGADASSFNLREDSSTDLSIQATLQPKSTLSAGTYALTVSGSDTFGHQVEENITVTVQAQAPIIDSNGSFFAIESALSESAVTISTDGIPGTQAQFTANQEVTWSLDNTTWIEINTSGYLSLNADLSGSTKQSGATILNNVTATNNFGLTSTLPVTVTVTDNEPPAFTDTLFNRNNNETNTSAVGFGKITVTDPQGIDNVTITDFNGADVSSFTFTPTPPGSVRTYAVSSSAALNSGSYTFHVTASDSYNLPVGQGYTITVIENLPPTITLTGFSKTTAQATNGSTIGTALAADPQNDSISSFTLSGADSSKFTAVLASSTATSKTYSINATEDLTANNYNLSGSATDSFGHVTVEPIPVVISANAPDTPEKSHANFYIIESATASMAITGDSSGLAGSLAQMSTDQSVSWSIAPTSPYVTIDSNGYLLLRGHVSGSAKTNGSEIIVTVVATNTFDEASSRIVDIDVTENLVPVLSYTGLTQTVSNATDGDTVGTVTATDTQDDSITSIVISGGANQSSFTLVNTATTRNTKTYNINVDGSDLSQGTYTIELTATDSFKKQTVETKTITVNADAAPVEKIYIYGSTRGAGSLTSANAAGVLGDPGLDDVDIISNSPMEKFKASNIGDATISVGGGTMTRIHTGSLARMTDLDTFGDLNFSNALQQILILFPSGSSIENQPTAMYDGTLPASSPQSGRFALYDNNATIPGVVSSGVHYFDLDAGQSVDGFSRWGLIFSEAANQNNATFHIIPDSGSAP